tara:strand:+ start:5723 stop:5977 length:255 start_codon:yes stop_codon:yes gene_type:complete
MTTGVTVRSRKDFVSNIAFEHLLSELIDVHQSELTKLTNDAKEGDIQKVNVQGGVVEGVHRVIKRIENYRLAALEDERNQGDLI